VLLRLILAAVLIPLIELALLRQLSLHTGWTVTVGIVLVTGVAGAWLAKRQGRSVWLQIHQQLQSGQTPSRAITEGVMILIAGTLLITPGLLTDLLGLAMLIPACRRIAARQLTAWFLKRTKVQFQSMSFGVEEEFVKTPESASSEQPSVRVVDPDAPRITQPHDAS